MAWSRYVEWVRRGLLPVRGPNQARWKAGMEGRGQDEGRGVGGCAEVVKIAWTDDTARVACEDGAKARRVMRALCAEGVQASVVVNKEDKGGHGKVVGRSTQSGRRMGVGVCKQMREEFAEARQRKRRVRGGEGGLGVVGVRGERGEGPTEEEEEMDRRRWEEEVDIGWMHSGMDDSVAVVRSGRLHKVGLGESDAGGYKEPQGGGKHEERSGQSRA